MRTYHARGEARRRAARGDPAHDPQPWTSHSRRAPTDQPLCPYSRDPRGAPRRTRRRRRVASRIPAPKTRWTRTYRARPRKGIAVGTRADTAASRGSTRGTTGTTRVTALKYPRRRGATAPSPARRACSRAHGGTRGSETPWRCGRRAPRAHPPPPGSGYVARHPRHPPSSRRLISGSPPRGVRPARPDVATFSPVPQRRPGWNPSAVA